MSTVTKLRHLLAALALCALLPSGARAQNGGEALLYTVQPGETLYRIAHNHGVSVEQVIACNAGLEAERIQSGQRIRIPQASPAPTKAQAPAAVKSAPAAPRKAQPAQTPQTTYKVKRKDTAFSIAKAFGVTMEELYAANPVLREEGHKLRKGDLLVIPAHKEKPRGLSAVRVAVVLPFAGDGVENVRSVEFYRGLLMGVERLKEEGLNVYISAHNEPAPDAGTAQLMQKVAAEKPDVVIGGVYPVHFADLAAAASGTTKVVIPFSSKVPQVGYRPEVFLLNTPSALLEKMECDLFLASFKKGTRVLILQSGETENSSFAKTLTERLTAAKHSVVRLAANSAPESLLLNLGAKTKGRLVVVSDATTEKAAAAALGQARALRALLPAAEISVVAPHCWLPYAAGRLKKEIHENDTHIITPSYFYPHTAMGRAFTESYRQWFGGELLPCTPLMAPLGYDLATAFLGGLRAYGHDFSTQPALAADKALQSHIGFTQAAAGGGYINSSVWLVRFKPDMSIVKLSAK